MGQVMKILILVLDLTNVSAFLHIKVQYNRFLYDMNREVKQTLQGQGNAQVADSLSSLMLTSMLIVAQPVRNKFLRQESDMPKQLGWE